MNYDDFPILDNTTYQILQEQYTNHQTDHHEIIGKIFNKLNSISMSEISDLKYFNKKILSALEESKSIISTTLQNFCQTFMIENNANNHIKAINIFSFLYEILECTNLIRQLINLDIKLYYKTFLNQSLTNLYKAVSDILSSLQRCTVHFFKYM